MSEFLINKSFNNEVVLRTSCRDSSLEETNKQEKSPEVLKVQVDIQEEQIIKKNTQNDTEEEYEISCKATAVFVKIYKEI